MPREETQNYGASTSTRFQWATTDQDLFDREFDLYRLSQALEFHTHAPTRGLPIGVGGIGADAVNTAAIAALAVTTAKIADLAVTNVKLAEGAVTRNKVTWPLIQLTNDMAGGFTLQNTGGTHRLGFYMDAAGLAVFGSGTPSAISPNLILGQTGQVSVGTLQGAGKFNVFQTTDTIGSGIRLYHPNTIHSISVRNDTTGRLCIDINANSFFFMHPTTGYVTLGAAANDTARLTLVQTNEDAGQGFRLINPTLGQGNGYVVNDGSFVLQSATTAVKLQHAANAFAPFTNNVTALGVGGADANTRRWSSVNAVDANFSGNVTVSGTLTAPGGGVPLGGVIWFRTAAELTAAGASWTPETSLEGRIPYGAGTTYGQTFAENTNTTSTNWTPAASVTASTSGKINPSLPYSAVGGGSNSASVDHGHTVNMAGTTTAWFPPGRIGVFGRRI